jgi:hypothetical protein
VALLVLLPVHVLEVVLPASNTAGSATILCTSTSSSATTSTCTVVVVLLVHVLVLLAIVLR